MGSAPQRKVARRLDSPECPTGAIVSLVAAGSTRVGWVAAAAATAQSTETGVWIRPRGAALTEELS